jgi:hypothetical protein
MPEQLSTMFSLLGPYEREILCDIAQRLLLGQKQYGQFKEQDGRNLNNEAYQELLDGLIYSTRQLKMIV